MAGSNLQAPVPPVVVPRAVGGDIIVRQFRPTDTSQVHALLFEGLVYGPGSPRNVALRWSLTSRLACLAYATSALGLSCLCSQNIRWKATGGVICSASFMFLLYLWKSIHNLFLDFCIKACNTDMADIMKSYDIPDSTSATEQGPGGFFVAAIESADGKTSEVVGYLGLDYHVNDDPTSGELRRMIVSKRHRRRRIGSLLITAAMAHARARSPPLLSLDLETTEFQPGARKLYEKHGFVLVGSRVMSGRMFQATVIRLRRKVAE